MYATNVEGSVNVIEAAARAGVERVVYTSSVATLGTNADGSPADEDTPVSVSDMIGHYKRSKYLAEEAVGGRARDLGLDVVTVNPSTPIGPGDVRPTPTGRIILDAARGRIPAYVDTGLNVVHVDDVAHGHVLAMRSGVPGRRYILGGTDLSLQEILGLVAARTGRPAPITASYPTGLSDRSLTSPKPGPDWPVSEPRVSVDGARMADEMHVFLER